MTFDHNFQILRWHKIYFKYNFNKILWWYQKMAKCVHFEQS